VRRPEDEISDRGGPPSGGELPQALSDLETAVLDACAGEEQWPAQIAAGVYAGVDFAIANPDLAKTWVVDSASDATFRAWYEWVVARLAEFIRARAPVDARLPASTDEALVAGIVGLVGDHVRIGRLERLAELRPELVLLALLPYLGFAEAQSWANRAADPGSTEA
jgi:hypothetical protein